MPFKVHKRTIKQLESCDRISLGVWMYINGFFCALPCERPIGQVPASTSPTEFAKICFILGIILDVHDNTELSKKMDGIWNRYNLKSTGRIYTFGILKCSEKFKVLDLP